MANLMDGRVTAEECENKCKEVKDLCIKNSKNVFCWGAYLYCKYSVCRGLKPHRF